MHKSLLLNERLIVALDVSNMDQACSLVDSLAPLGPVFKIGYHSLFSGGLQLAQDLVRQGHKVFLDAKLYDIPATVASGTRALAAMGFWCLTAHAHAQNIAGAIAGAKGTALRILGVTVLTSMTQKDLSNDGLDRSVGEQVILRAKAALDAGAHGLISSPLEVSDLRRKFGLAPFLITPGIRLAQAAAGDQARFMTPFKAIRAGADALVIGRPVIQASNPLDVAKRIVDDISDAL